MCIVTVIAYVVAGVAKVRNAGPEWLDGEVLRVQIAYDNLRKIELGDMHSPLGAQLVRYAWIFPPLAWATMVLELGAPLALLGRWPARAWVVAVWGFHVGVAAVMWISFLYPLSGVAFCSFFEVETLLRRPTLRRWLRAFGPPVLDSPSAGPADPGERADSSPRGE
jgi:hypothetical protein